jgi:asparagine N-glycosylation enzyme membrane subunit Stt3
LGVLYEPKPGDESANSVNAYKLFEIVQGAVIEVIAEPNSRVTAAVTIESPSGRHFNYSANATTNDSGIARMRVPYSTGSTSPVHATGPYRISSGFQIARVDVDDAEVRNGSTVPITLGVGFESFQ